MKRIILLSLLLLGLGIFTFQYEELGGVKRKNLEDQKIQVVDNTNLGEMQEIRGVEFHIVKSGEVFKTSKGELVDFDKVQRYLDVLGNMKVRRYLEVGEYSEDSRSLFFPKDSPKLSFKFEKGEVSFCLGKKLEFDQSFYMEVEQAGKVKQMIAFDSSPNAGTYDKESFHRNAEKYLRFKSLILLTEDFFIDTHIFQKEYLTKKAPWQSIELNNLRNRAFRLDIVQRSTFPAPPKGMGMKEEAFKDYMIELVNFNGTNWLPSGILEDKVADLKIIKEDASVDTVLIYKKYNSESGNFAYLVEKDKVLSFNAKAMSLFFKNAQDFWSLRAVPTDKPQKMQLAFPEQSKIDVEFKYGNLFQALSLQKKAGEAISTSFKVLVTLFSREADHLTSLENGEELEKSLFKVNWPGENGMEAREFHVILNKGELILANKRLGYKLHYRLEDFSDIGTKLKDFFLKQ